MTFRPAGLTLAPNQPPLLLRICTISGANACALGANACTAGQGQGKRNDIKALLTAVKRGASDRELLEDEDTEQAAFKYHRHVQWARAAMIPPRTKAPDVLFLWGPTGTGKSWKAREVSQDHVAGTGGTVLWKMNGCKWYDGLNGSTKCMVWDEFVPKDAGVHLGHMLRLLDGYPLQVEIKGGAMEFNVDLIIFTSNYDPMDWYYDAEPASRRAWDRRVLQNKVEHCTVNWNDITVIEELI